MKELLKYSLLFVFIAFFGRSANAGIKNSFSIVDGIKYKYELHTERDPVTNDIFAPENQEVEIYSIGVSSPDIELDVVTLPASAYNEEFGVKVIFKGFMSGAAGKVIVNTLRAGSPIFVNAGVAYHRGIFVL